MDIKILPTNRKTSTNSDIRNKNKKVHNAVI